jgi:hypothetical protein
LHIIPKSVDGARHRRSYGFPTKIEYVDVRNRPTKCPERESRSKERRLLLRGIGLSAGGVQSDLYARRRQAQHTAEQRSEEPERNPGCSGSEETSR